MRRPGESSSSRIPRRGWNILARVLRMPLVLSLKMPMSTTKSRALKHISAKSIRFQPRVQYRFRKAPSLSAISSTNTVTKKKFTHWKVVFIGTPPHSTSYDDSASSSMLPAMHAVKKLMSQRLASRRDAVRRKPVSSGGSSPGSSADDAK